MIGFFNDFVVRPTAPCALAAGRLCRFLVGLLVITSGPALAQTQPKPPQQAQPQTKPQAQQQSQQRPGAAATAGASLAAKPVVDYAQRYAQQCAACHGADGKGAPNLAPSLAGQHSFYAITQLFLYKNGRRDSEVMNAMAKDFSNDDLRGFSEVIGKLPVQATQPTAAAPDEARMALGKSLASSHLCISCHGADLAGAQQVPRLAGQHEDYLVRVLTEFRSGKRLGYTTAMNEALSGLNPQGLENLSYYLARHPGVK